MSRTLTFFQSSPKIEWKNRDNSNYSLCKLDSFSGLFMELLGIWEISKEEREAE